MESIGHYHYFLHRHMFFVKGAHARNLEDHVSI